MAGSKKTTARGRSPEAELVVKIGGDEVRFAAGAKAVEERFDRLVERLLADRAPRGRAPQAGASRATSPVPLPSSPAVTVQLARQARGVGSAGDNYPAFTLDVGRIAEVYSVSEAGVLSLRVLPRGLEPRERQADALMLLLYGMLVLLGVSPATAPALLRSARVSGLELDRASRLLARRARYVATTGRKRGKRYRLTPAGVAYCEELVAALSEEPAEAPSPVGAV